MTERSARRLIVALGAVAGIGLRVAIHATALGRPDSDEVLTALMVRHLGDAGFPVFVWGQHYGGTAWLPVVAVSLGLLGDNLLGLRVPNLLLSVANVWLLYRLARRAFPEVWAALAGVLLWIGPPATLWFGIHEQLFYPPTTALGLGLLLLVHRMVERPGAWTDPAGFGLLAGIGWWTGANIIYFAVPAVVWAVVACTGWEPARMRVESHPEQVRGRADRVWGPTGLVDGRRLGVLVGAAAAGGLPWLVDVVRSDGAPLSATSTFPRIGTFPSRVGYLFREALPGALGARDILSHDWAWGAVGMALAIVLLAALAIGWWQGWKQRSWDAIGAVWFVVVYAAIGWSPDDPNLRYTFFAAPFLVMLVARAARFVATGVGPLAKSRADAAGGVTVGVGGEPTFHRARRATSVALVVIVIWTGLSAMSLARLHHLSENGGTVYRVGNVPDLDDVIAILDRERVTRVWGDYWVAYRLVFETDERIIATPSAGIRRYDPYTDELRRADRSAWVALKATQADALVAAMNGLGVGYQRFDTEHFVVIVPERPIQPEELPEAARRAPETPRPTL